MEKNQILEDNGVPISNEGDYCVLVLYISPLEEDKEAEIKPDVLENYIKKYAEVQKV